MRIESPLFALGALTRTQRMLSKALERLSSGRRINSAADDPAGLSIATGLDTQLRGSNQGIRNINDAQAVLATAEGGISTQVELAQRMNELAVQAATGTLGTNDRTYLNDEFQQLLAEFNRIAEQTNFNGTNLLDGTFSTTTIQVGSTANQQISINLSSTLSSAVFTPATGATGTFHTRSTFQVGSSPWAVTSADLNGDGKPDLITVDSNDNTISALLGNGDGTFKVRITSAVASSPKFVTAGDVNGDGIADLVTANSNGTVSVLIGNGDGTFKAQTTFQVGNSPYGVQLKDVNGDGKLDIITTDGADNTLSVLIGNGDGTFKARTTYQTGTWPLVFKVADINGDGKPDLIDGDWGDSTISVQFGNGDGTFGPRVTTSLTYRPQGLAIGDFNGDGKLDLAVQGLDNTISILTGNGNGTFHSPVVYQTGTNITTDNLIATDVNGDGKLDLVSGDSQDNTLSIFEGNGDGTFQARVTYQTGNRPVGLAAADFNGDGASDLAEVDHNDNTVSLFLGTSRSSLPFDISTQLDAQNMLGVLESGLSALSTQRSTIGAYQSRLDSASNMALITVQNISQAKSQIMDTDFAEETAELVRAQILQQAGLSVLGQVNLNSKLILNLLSSFDTAHR